MWIYSELIRQEKNTSAVPQSAEKVQQRGDVCVPYCLHPRSTVSDFYPRGQCWNCIHLSSLYTQLELTLAFIFAAGQWVSLTETFSPLRWLLSWSVTFSLSLPLFFFCAHPHPVCFLFLCILISISSFSSFVPFTIPFFFSSILSLCLSLHHSPTLAWDRECCRKKATELVFSKSSVPPAEYHCMHVYSTGYVCVSQCWIQDRGVICFPVTACDPKTMSEVRSIAGKVPAAGREAMDEIWTSLHHQTIWQQRQGGVGKPTVKCTPLQMIHYWLLNNFNLNVNLLT